MLNEPTIKMKKLIKLIEEQTNWRAHDDGSGNGIILNLFVAGEAHDGWVEATTESVVEMINE